MPDHDPRNLQRDPDLGDPAVLAPLLESLAEGMAQQSAALREGTALGPHPNLGFLLEKVAAVMSAAVPFVRAQVPPAPPAPPAGDDMPAPAAQHESPAPPAPPAPPPAPRRR